MAVDHGTEMALPWRPTAMRVIGYCKIAVGYHMPWRSTREEQPVYSAAVATAAVGRGGFFGNRVERTTHTSKCGNPNLHYYPSARG